MSEKIPESCECPVYHSRETFSVGKENNHIHGPGYREWIIWYQCDGCSTRFGNPKKFFKKIRGGKKG